MKNPFAVKGVDDEETPPGVYGYRPYLLSFCASWASAMYGYDSAFIGGTLNLPAFQRTFGLDKASATEKAALSSNIVSTFQAGAFFGSALGFPIAERWGRKVLLLVSAAIFMVGAGLQLNGTLGALYAGRALTGMGVGASAMVMPIYVSECAPPLIRGRLVGVFEVMLQVALVFGFWVNYGVNKNVSSATSKQWHIPVAIQFVPAGLLILSMIFMVESPRWLVSKNRSHDAQAALAWIRNLPQEHRYIQKELVIIETGVNHELESTGGKQNSVQMFKELTKKGVRNRLAIALGLMLFQNMTGINAVNYYSPTIFKSIGFTGTSVGLLATGVYGIVKMLATVVFIVVVVDRFGRRLPLLVGAVGAGFAMFYLGVYANLSNSLHTKPPKDAGANAAVAMIYIYAIFYGASWNGIPWLFTSEVLPTRVRTLGMAICVCWQWLSQFVVVYSLPYMIKGIGYGTFLFFGCCTALAFLFAYLFVPETKHVVMEDMELLFGPDVSIWATKARKNYLDHRDRGQTIGDLADKTTEEKPVVLEREHAGEV